MIVTDFNYQKTVRMQVRSLKNSAMEGKTVASLALLPRKQNAYTSRHVGMLDAYMVFELAANHASNILPLQMLVVVASDYD